MKPLVLKIKGKDTVVRCLKPDSNNIYADTITRGLPYVDVSQKSIKVINLCDASFILPAQTLFVQVDNLGSTFVASIKDTVVAANQIVNVPVYYNGTYNGVNNSPSYVVSINGMSFNYNLTIISTDTVGTISNIIKDLGNRVNYTFIPADFTNAHTDPDGDTIISVTLYGNTQTIQYNNQPYVGYTEVYMSDIQQGKLKHVAPDTNAPYGGDTNYRIKDTQGNIIT